MSRVTPQPREATIVCRAIHCVCYAFLLMLRLRSGEHKYSKHFKGRYADTVVARTSDLSN
jgi:hypothetical protein|eukprot:COSAG01_NODE_3858_length_5620_cov_53.828111_2_plen_60_part_00